MGYYASRGNCTAPNECTCWCKAKYIENICMRKGGIGIFGPWTAHRECRGPFQDLLGKGPAFAVMDMVNYRNLLDPDEMFARAVADADSRAPLMKRMIGI